MGGGDWIEGRHRSTAICPRNTSRRKARYIEARASSRHRGPALPDQVSRGSERFPRQGIPIRNFRLKLRRGLAISICKQCEKSPGVTVRCRLNAPPSNIGSRSKEKPLVHLNRPASLGSRSGAQPIDIVGPSLPIKETDYGLVERIEHHSAGAMRDRDVLVRAAHLAVEPLTPWPGAPEPRSGT